MLSLIAHASKIMLKMLTKRVEAKTGEFIGRNQFGFRKGYGTRDAIGVLRTLCERSLEHGKDVYICFVDFEKAFDRVNWVKLMQILKSIHVDWRDRRMIQELYMRQEAVIRIADEDSDPAVIGRGVRQGCPLSPLLFSVYAEMMMIEAMEGIDCGIVVGGESINDIRFAADQGMLSNSAAGLQEIMDQLNDTAKTYMKINVKKTKTMIVTRKEGQKLDIRVDGQSVDQVKQFKYLGSIVSEDGRCTKDVKARIGMAKDAFTKRRELLSRKMSSVVKKKMVKTLVYGQFYMDVKLGL